MDIFHNLKYVISNFLEHIIYEIYLLKFLVYMLTLEKSEFLIVAFIFYWEFSELWINESESDVAQSD